MARYLPLALAAVALGVRIPIAFLPIDQLVAWFLPDDAFYYFEIARNTASGHGISFDGSVTSTGFHPLWMVVVTACYSLPVAPDISMRLALAVAALLSAAGVYPLFALVGRHFGRLSATAAALVYGLTPSLIFMSVNGLETAVLVTALLFCLDAFDRNMDSREGGWIAPGLTGGLMILARTDYAVILAWLLVVLALRTGLRRAIRAGLIAAAIALPWLLWVAAVSGSVFPSSASAVPTLAHGTGPSGAAALAHGFHEFGVAWADKIPDYYFAAPALHLAVFCGIAVFAALLAKLLFERRPLAALLAGFGGGGYYAHVHSCRRPMVLPRVVPSSPLSARCLDRDRVAEFVARIEPVGSGDASDRRLGRVLKFLSSPSTSGAQV